MIYKIYYETCSFMNYYFIINVYKKTITVNLIK